MVLCDIGYIIQDHIPAVMQLLTNELRDYGMQLMTTKCLNTAVMVWYLFLGEREDDFKKASYCDARTVQRRGREARRMGTEEFAKSEFNPVNVVENFGEDLLETLEDRNNNGGDPKAPRCGTRTLYYVMMTDADLPRVEGAKPSATVSSLLSSGPAETQFFPGHVYVIEKVWQGRNRNRYNVYQSYINNYTLDGHARQNRSFSLSHSAARELVNNLRMMYTSPVWDEKHTRFWKTFTHVDVERYEGYQFSQQSYMCYRKANTTNCTSNLERFLRAKLEALETAIAKKEVLPDEAYGDRRLYTGSQKNVAISILTNAEMRDEIRALLRKL